MKLNRYVALLLAALSFAIAGCGGAPQAEKIVVAPTAIENSVRATLEGYEKSGEVGSSLTSLESDINGIKATNSAKAEELRTGYMKLIDAKGKDEVKAIAKEMLSKL